MQTDLNQQVCMRRSVRDTTAGFRFAVGSDGTEPGRRALKLVQGVRSRAREENALGVCNSDRFARITPLELTASDFAAMDRLVISDCRGERRSNLAPDWMKLRMPKSSKLRATKATLPRTVGPKSEVPTLLQRLARKVGLPSFHRPLQSSRTAAAH